MNEKQLLELKEQIDTAKDEVKELEGRKKYLLQQLKEDWGCKTLDEAEEKLDDLKEEVQTIKDKIDEGTNKLEEKYELD